MRFLRTDLQNGFRLEEFDHHELANKDNGYAVLSHRWGNKEVLLKDLTSVSPNDQVA